MSAPQRFELPPLAQATQIARRHLADTLPGNGLDHLATDAAIVVSELVENVLQHTTGGCTLFVHCDAPTLAITVTDTSALPPEILPPSTTRVHGRGLLLVEKIAHRWGWRPVGTGKVVWANLTA